ncbi:MAG TPA: hypothetical protein VME22_31870 [Solirubrobacteraceae bacterium]|nr:hypothetical protein [Solirubrobacteraceae bacterium]
MVVDQTRRLWLGTLNAHVRAVHAHEIAASLFERIGDISRAHIESGLAASERVAYAQAAARHPEWVADVSVGLVGSPEAALGTPPRAVGDS